jgi:hypothetical protein
MAEDKNNSAKGRTSYDSKIGDSLVHFFNKNVTPYATEVGGPKFDLVPVTKNKDIMINAARMHAKQEYNRIMELVAVLQKQANELQKRLDLTEMVHAAEYQMQLYHGQYYWLCYDHNKKLSRLVSLGPNDWCTGSPQDWEYIARIQWLGDHTFREVDENGDPIS